MTASTALSSSETGRPCSSGATATVTSAHLQARQAAVNRQRVPDQDIVETVHHQLAAFGGSDHRAPQLVRRVPRLGQLGPPPAEEVGDGFVALGVAVVVGGDGAGAGRRVVGRHLVHHAIEIAGDDLAKAHLEELVLRNAETGGRGARPIEELAVYLHRDAAPGHGLHFATAPPGAGPKSALAEEHRGLLLHGRSHMAVQVREQRGVRVA